MKTSELKFSIPHLAVSACYPVEPPSCWVGPPAGPGGITGGGGQPGPAAWLPRWAVSNPQLTGGPGARRSLGDWGWGSSQGPRGPPGAWCRLKRPGSAHQALPTERVLPHSLLMLARPTGSGWGSTGGGRVCVRVCGYGCVTVCTSVLVCTHVSTHTCRVDHMSCVHECVCPYTRQCTPGCRVALVLCVCVLMQCPHTCACVHAHRNVCSFVLSPA